MNEQRILLSKDLIGFGLIALFVLLFFYIDGSTFSIPVLWQKFFSIFIGIVLKALPFLFIAAFLSAGIQKFVKERTIVHFIRKRPIIAFLLSFLLGATISGYSFIPFLRNLIKNGMPSYLGMVLLFGTPHLNPIVLLTAYFAFQATPDFIYTRIGIGLLLCIFNGIIVFLFFQNQEVLKVDIKFTSQKTNNILNQASNEFFELGKYLITGAVIVSLLLSFLDQDFLSKVGSNDLLAPALLMLLSFMMSISPTVDSLVVTSFGPIFSTSSILAFLLFGSILNVKIMSMLLTLFRFRFVVSIMAIVSLSTYCFVLLFQTFL